MTRPRVTVTIPPIVAAKLAILSRSLGVPPSAAVRALVERAVDEALQRYGVEVDKEEIRKVMKRLRRTEYLSKKAAEEATDEVF